MTTDQIMGLLRQIIPVIGGILVTLGWVTPQFVTNTTAFLASVGGPAIVLAGAVWAFIANSRSSILKSAAAMQGTEVKTTPTGGTSIVVKDPSLAKAAVDAATPVSGNA